MERKNINETQCQIIERKNIRYLYSSKDYVIQPPFDLQEINSLQYLAIKSLENIRNM